MHHDEEAPDAVDVQPVHGVPRRAHRRPLAFPWVILVAGIVLSAIIMAAITISTVPLSVVTAPLHRR